MSLPALLIWPQAVRPHTVLDTPPCGPWAAVLTSLRAGEKRNAEARAGPRRAPSAFARSDVHRIVNSYPGSPPSGDAPPWAGPKSPSATTILRNTISCRWPVGITFGVLFLSPARPHTPTPYAVHKPAASSVIFSTVYFSSAAQDTSLGVTFPFPLEGPVFIDLLLFALSRFPEFRRQALGLPGRGGETQPHRLAAHGSCKSSWKPEKAATCVHRKASSLCFSAIRGKRDGSSLLLGLSSTPGRQL